MKYTGILFTELKQIDSGLCISNLYIYCSSMIPNDINVFSKYMNNIAPICVNFKMKWTNSVIYIILIIL